MLKECDLIDEALISSEQMRGTPNTKSFLFSCFPFTVPSCFVLFISIITMCTCIRMYVCMYVYLCKLYMCLWLGCGDVLSPKAKYFFIILVMCSYIIGDGNSRRFPCPDMNWEQFQRIVQVLYIYCIPIAAKVGPLIAYLNLLPTGN